MSWRGAWGWDGALRGVGLWLGILVCLGCGCGVGDGGGATAERRPRVIASFYPLYDFARTLGGTNYDVVCLTPPGGDPHGMDASPSAARAVAGADLVLLMGLGMDGWVDKLAKSEGRSRFVASEVGIPLRRLGKGALSEFGDPGHQPNPEEMDPHIWLDPVFAAQIVTQVAESMIELAPRNAELVRGRRDELVKELNLLHEEFMRDLREVRRRQLVTFHGAFSYLFARYGLETVGVIELFPGDEPSAGYLKALVDVMRQARMKVIFAEPQLPDRPAQVIAGEIGGRVERLDPCETILPEAPGDTYVQRQRSNLRTLQRVLNEP